MGDEREQRTLLARLSAFAGNMGLCKTEGAGSVFAVHAGGALSAQANAQAAVQRRGFSAG